MAVMEDVDQQGCAIGVLIHTENHHITTMGVRKNEAFRNRRGGGTAAGEIGEKESKEEGVTKKRPK